jgi:hypothetical protein
MSHRQRTTRRRTNTHQEEGTVDQDVIPDEWAAVARGALEGLIREFNERMCADPPLLLTWGFRDADEARLLTADEGGRVQGGLLNWHEDDIDVHLQRDPSDVVTWCNLSSAFKKPFPVDERPDVLLGVLKALGPGVSPLLAMDEEVEAHYVSGAAVTLPTEGLRLEVFCATITHLLHSRRRIEGLLSTLD